MRVIALCLYLYQCLYQYLYQCIYQYLYQYLYQCLYQCLCLHNHRLSDTVWRHGPCSEENPGERGCVVVSVSCVLPPPASRLNIQPLNDALWINRPRSEEDSPGEWWSGDVWWL